MFKKIVSLMLAGTMVLGLAACGGKSGGTHTDSSGAGGDGTNKEDEAGKEDGAGGQEEGGGSSGEVLHLWHYWDSELQQGLLQEMVGT